MMRWSAAIGILGVGGALALGAGCQPVSIQKIRGRAAAVRPPVIGPIEVGAISIADPGNPRDPGTSLAQSSERLQASLAHERKDPGYALMRASESLQEASEALSASRSDPPGPNELRLATEARRIINEATRQVLRLSSGRHIELDEGWAAGMAARGMPVAIVRDDRTWDPERFDELLLADDYAIKGIEHRFGSDGLGVPLIGIRRFRFGDLEDRRGEEKYLMPRQVYAVTAVLKPVPSPEGAPGFRLELLDPLRARDAEFGGRREPLASDLTTPLAYHFIRSPLPILQEVGLLDPQWLEKLAGLYMLHPYEPGKIPVILVHGLRSSPAAWMRVINDLRGDPKIRDRYQFWLFLYPTGTPFPASAAKLRAMLDELRAVVDPGRTDLALDRSVLIGHSMGGLISKMMVLRSGDEFWKLIGTRPFEELKATPERKEMLRKVFFFEPHPSVRRVVFIATPHRGSELGDQFIGRLADRLIRLPSSLRQTYRAVLLQNGRDFFTADIRAGVPSSIDELRRDNKLLMMLNRLPMGPGVQIHSIIGQKDPSLPIEQGTDGVVPYSSSHLDGASSELVVRGDHGCQDGPDTIKELRRILYLHLGRPDANRRNAIDEGRPPETLSHRIDPARR